MTRRRGQHPRRTVLPLLAALAVLLPALAPALVPALLPGSPPSAAAAASTAAAAVRTAAGTDADADADDARAAADRGLQVHLTDLRPAAPVAGGTLQLVGTVRNDTDAAATDLTAFVGTGTRLISRGALELADADPPATRDRAARELPDVAAGQEVAFDVRVPVDALRLTADGVYPLQLQVRGRAGPAAPAALGTVRSWLPWFATQRVDPLRVAWLLPVTDRPRQRPDEVLLDDDLATSLAPGGRLGRLLAAGRSGETGACPPEAQPDPSLTPPPAVNAPRRAGPSPSPTPSPAVPARPAPVCTAVPVTYAVDPDLLHAADTMTRPYLVAGPGGTRPGEGTEAAIAWLASLRAAAAAGDALALPYAEPDVVALTRSGSGLAADVPLAKTYGTTLTRDLLGRDPLATVAVPPAGRLTGAALDALTTDRTTAVVLGDDAVRLPADDGRSTAGAQVTLPGSVTSGPLTGLVPDRRLGELLQPDAGTDARLAAQRWLVETAMISAQLPARGRTLLVALPRGADVDPDLVGRAVASTGQVPWMCAVRLGDVAAGREGCATSTLPVSDSPEREADVASAGPTTPELPAAVLQRVAAARASATQLAYDVVEDGTDAARDTRARLQRAWLRAESSAWRDDPAGGARFAGLLASDVGELRSKVSVLTGRVLLTGSNGRVSVAVLNELDLPVTVSVRLRAPANARLSETQTALLRVPARTSLPVQVDARTSTSGRFVVRAELLDRQGQPFGDPQELLVRSTRYGAVALAVTGLGAAVLLVAAGVRLTRRALGRRPPDRDPPDRDPPDHDPPDRDPPSPPPPADRPLAPTGAP